MKLEDINWSKKNSESAEGAFQNGTIQIESRYDKYTMVNKVRISIFTSRGHSMVNLDFKDEVNVSKEIKNPDSKLSQFILMTYEIH